MAKNRIYVNKEYEKAFDSICQLIQGGCFKGTGWKVVDGIINDGVYEYQLTSLFTDKSEEVKHGFNKDGATWFRALRGQKVENNNAIWTSFIETAGIEYHKRYSVVEYKQQPRTRAEKEREFEENKRIVEDFTSLFYPGFYQKTELIEVEGEAIKEDIYGVSMRIELSGGTGASLPILCKVFFSKSGRIVAPIPSFIAQEIDANLSEIIPEYTDDDKVISGESAIDTTLNAVDKLINSANVNFADYICYSDKSDKVAVENLLAQLSHDAIELECQRVDVLYISHITATSYMYDVSHNGRPIFRLSKGLNKSLTISCSNCGANEKLVESNVISFVKDGVQETVLLDLNLPNFGLTQEQIDDILEFSAFGDHYIRVSCPLANRGQECKSLKCKAQLFDADSGDKVLYKCKDCPYPEIVYTSVTGEKKYTPAMIFAKDIMTLVDAKSSDVKLVKCEDCGRYFTKSAMKGKTCSLCSSCFSREPQHKELYKKYKNLLPLSTRLLSLFARKSCVEDDEILILVVGYKKYYVNKLNVKEHGYIEKPRKRY